MEYSVLTCVTTLPDGSAQSACLTTDLVFKTIDVPDLAFYEDIFINVDPLLVAEVFIGSLLLFGVGIGVGGAIKFLKTRY